MEKRYFFDLCSPHHCNRILTVKKRSVKKKKGKISHNFVDHAKNCPKRNTIKKRDETASPSSTEKGSPRSEKEEIVFREWKIIEITIIMFLSPPPR